MLSCWEEEVNKAWDVLHGGIILYISRISGILVVFSLFICKKKNTDIQ